MQYVITSDSYILACGCMIVLGTAHVWIVALTFLCWNQDKLHGGFRRRKLTRIDRFSNNFRMAIATGLFVLLAWCLFRTEGYFWNEAPGLRCQKSRHALLVISSCGTALVRHARQHGVSMAVHRSQKNWRYDMKWTQTKEKSCPVHTSCAICLLRAHEIRY